MVLSITLHIKTCTSVIFFSGPQKDFDKDEQIKKQSPKLPFQHYVQTTNIKSSLEKKKYRIDDGKSFCLYSKELWKVQKFRRAS